MKQPLYPNYALDVYPIENTEGLLSIERQKTTLSPPSFWFKGIIGLFAVPIRLSMALCILDILAASLGIRCAILLKSYFIGPEIPGSSISLSIYYVIYLIVIFFLRDAYRHFKDKRPELELKTIIISNIYAFIPTLATHFIFSKGTEYSWSLLLIGFLLTSGLLLCFRFGLKNLLEYTWSKGYAKQNVVIMGNSFDYIKWFLDHLTVQRYLGFNLLGYVAAVPLDKAIPGLSYLGTFEQLPKIAKIINLDKVFFAISYGSQGHHELIGQLEECSRLKIPAFIISEIFNGSHFNLALDDYTGTFQVARRRPAYDNPLCNCLKRLFDISVSLVLLLVSLPFWAFASAVIKWQDGGPILFRHRLVGKDGVLFDMLKFRTMIVNAKEFLENNQELFDKFKVNYKLGNDPRITPFGKWLRKTSLDELPQLINVLKGDMSLVGPRPVQQDELEKFGDFKFVRIKIRPGLTGFWQVSGRSDTNYAERVQMDRFYMNTCSIWLDLWILLKTPFKVIKSDGAM